MKGGKDRRSRRHLHVRRPRQPRTAADRRPAHRAAEALVGRHRRGRQEARRRRDHARAAARQRRLSDQGVRRRPHHRLRAGARTIGARTSTSTSAATISTSCASNISATRPSRSKRSRPTQIDWRTENSAKNWATAYDFPAVEGQARASRRNSRSAQSACMQAFAFNIRRDKFKDPRRAPRLQLRASISRR